MYGFDLSNANDIKEIADARQISGPISIGEQYVVAYPVENGEDSLYFGEIVEVIDIVDGGFSFQFRVFDSPDRIVVVPAAVAVVALVHNE